MQIAAIIKILLDLIILVLLIIQLRMIEIRSREENEINFKLLLLEKEVIRIGEVQMRQSKE